MKFIIGLTKGGGRIPVVTMVWVVSRSRLKAPPGTSSPYTSPLTPPGQRNCASWASQPQKSVTIPPQPGGGDHEISYEHVVALGGKKTLKVEIRNLQYSRSYAICYGGLFCGKLPRILIKFSRNCDTKSNQVTVCDI